MKIITLLLSSFLLLSCANQTNKKTSNGNGVDGVMVSNMMEGSKLSKEEAATIIKSFKSKYPNYTPTMLNNAGVMVSILANRNGEKGKMFFAKKSGSNWTF